MHVEAFSSKTLSCRQANIKLEYSSFKTTDNVILDWPKVSREVRCACADCERSLANSQTNRRSQLRTLEDVFFLPHPLSRPLIDTPVRSTQPRHRIKHYPIILCKSPIFHIVSFHQISFIPTKEEVYINRAHRKECFVSKRHIRQTKIDFTFPG